MLCCNSWRCLSLALPPSAPCGCSDSRNRPGAAPCRRAALPPALTSRPNAAAARQPTARRRRCPPTAGSCSRCTAMEELDIDCAICLSVLQDPCTLPCGTLPWVRGAGCEGGSLRQPVRAHRPLPLPPPLSPRRRPHLLPALHLRRPADSHPAALPAVQRARPAGCASCCRRSEKSLRESSPCSCTTHHQCCSPHPRLCRPSAEGLNPGSQPSSDGAGAGRQTDGSSGGSQRRGGGGSAGCCSGSAGSGAWPRPPPCAAGAHPTAAAFGAAAARAAAV